MQESRVDELIDFDFAFRAATELLPAGAVLDVAQRDAHVQGLRDAAVVATEHVQGVTGLDVAGALKDVAVLVVDRQGWAKANIQSFRALLDRSVTAALDAREKQEKISALSRRATGAELGALLAFLGTKVLGQYEPFGSATIKQAAPGDDQASAARIEERADTAVALRSEPQQQGSPTGRLLLVAPTISAIGRQLEVDEADFRLWVCLHEETHRVQFAAAPWLRDYLKEHIDSLGTDMFAETGLSERLGQILRQMPEVFGPSGSKQAIDLVQTPEQRAQLEQVTAVMSLLEGHADVVMDEVGPGVVPSVASIRAKFNSRRKGRQRGLDQFIRRFLGLDAKMRQYADGAVFVRAVKEKVGHEGLNAVWSGPQALPTPEEIADPARWVARVHG